MSISSDFYNVIDIALGVKRINSEEGSACDLIIGSKKAALIDTGLGLGDLPGLVRSLTDLPLLIFNTHCHCDHIGGNGLFAQPIHMGEEDIPTCGYSNDVFFRKTMLENRRLSDTFDREEYLGRGYGALIPVKEGDLFDLGELTIKVFDAPGHSAGSRAYLIPERRILYVGDSVGRTVLIFGYGAADRKTYIRTLDKLLGLPFDIILSSHNPDPMGREDMERCRRAALLADYETGEPFPNLIRNGDSARICCLPGMTTKDEKDPEYGAVILSEGTI